MLLQVYQLICTTHNPLPPPHTLSKLVHSLPVDTFSHSFQFFHLDLCFALDKLNNFQLHQMEK